MHGPTEFKGRAKFAIQVHLYQHCGVNTAGWKSTITSPFIYFPHLRHTEITRSRAISTPPSLSMRPKRAPLQSTPRCEPPPKEKVGIFGEGCEILEYAPGFLRYSSFCQCFQEKVRESLDRNLSSPHFSTTPLIPPAHHLLTVIISISYPTPCSIYVVTSGPLWPTFYHYKS